MVRQLNITSKNSNEVYHILYPNNLIGFCKYDFTLFMEHCIDLCRLFMRTGEYSVEDIVAVRSSISGCHKYFEKNMRGIFEKIVVDCWIEYLCRQNEVGIVTLWTNFMSCGNDFEKAVFARLSEYRHNHAINQWVNLLKLQEYAQRKVEFIFGVKLAGSADANARASYFDLMYNVALNEAGISVDELGGTEICTVGRTPNSPFVMNSASREIVRNVLGDMFYSEKVNVRDNVNPELSDQLAMDAFSLVKSYIPKNDDSLVNTIVKSMVGAPQKVYIPTSFKSVIDLEIDAIIESGAVIQRCERCHEYYLKDSEYNFDYCSRTTREGISCLEIVRRLEATEKENEKRLGADAENTRTVTTNAPHPLMPNEIATFSLRLDKLYKETAQRVNVDMTQRDFSEWYRRMLTIKRRITTGMLTENELSDFETYSRTHIYAHETEPPKTEKPAVGQVKSSADGERVKPFVFERVDREKAISRGILSPSNQPAAPYPPPQPLRAAPTVSQQPPPPQLYPQTRIIRGAEANIKFNYYDKPLEPVQRAPVAGSAEDKPRVAVPPRSVTDRGVRGENGFTAFNAGKSGYSDAVSEKAVNAHKIPSPLALDDDDIFDTDEVEAEIESLGSEPDFSSSVSLDEVEEDVKIYNVEQPAPAPKKPIENVKIFEPSKRKKTRLDGNQMRSAAEKLFRPLGAEMLAESETFDAEEETVEGIQPEIIQRPPDNPVKAKAVSAYRTLVEPRAEEPEQGASDFSEILRGINRSDGFEENTETDADGMPLSHKTKHVMDAIFKPSKASPFFSINLDDEEDK